MLTRRTLIAFCALLLLGSGVYFGTRSAVINQAPKNVMANIEAKIAKAAGGWNACYHNRAYGPRAAAAKRANPDSIISSMAYDVSNGPVRVSGKIWPRYWSLSLYQQNSDNFFVINDRQLEGANYDFLILQKGQDAGGLAGTPIISPTPKGIMLIRRFAADVSDMPGIHDNQESMFCGPAK